ncbi:alpha/beta fold hydrolase [Streptomyces roseofulvus]|uniref:Alpha/beta fold hydrolase n=2 Tax=Streptomyces TaxID=1883 RepID=A0ABU4K7J7_9ACTN|nr:alpha/beta fold hydrolase [Streptomyces roseolus]MDX2293365.1 alpha/beta fold hydrolase [Streptomyces roseolus]
MSVEPMKRDGRTGKFRRIAERPYARARVVLFPHGGGSASYFRSWAAAVPWDLDFLVAQYPGREDRYSEPMPDDIQTLAAVLADGPPVDGPELPTMLFGHSMGALVAYEVAREISAAGHHPLRLVVSGHPAPELTRPGTVHLGTDEELVEELRRTEATHREVLDDTDLVEAFLPTIRTDYRLSETYRPRPGARLIAPVSVLYGDRDPEITPREAEAWSDTTEGPCEVRVFEGGHFYLDHHRDQVVELLTAYARAAVHASAAPWPSAP